MPFGSAAPNTLGVDPNQIWGFANSFVFERTTVLAEGALVLLAIRMKRTV